MIKAQRTIFPPKVQVRNHIETNGSLIDDEYAKLFAENNFSVGVSFDGLPEIHDTHHKDAEGNPTSEIVINGIKLLRKHGISPVISCVITEDCLGREKEIYCFLKSIGGALFHFDPYRSSDISRSLSPDRYADFMIRMLEVWVKDDDPKIMIDCFSRWITKMLGLSSGSGAQVITPSGAPLHIKNNGDVEYWHSCLGNIYSQDLGLFQDLGLLLERKGEAEKKLLGSRGKCWEKCEWGNICGGGDNKFFYKGQNLLCSAYKKIFLKLQELIKNVKPYITQEDGDRSKGV